jgi:hypothetical protein
MNTRLSGSARVDDIQSYPQGEIRGLTKLVNITEDVRKFAVEQKLSAEDAVKRGLQEKLLSSLIRAPTFTSRRS